MNVYSKSATLDIKNSNLKYGVLFLITCLAVIFFIYKEIIFPKDRLQEYTKVYQEGLFKESFLRDVGDGINDKYTKSYAHLFVYQYFMNGGNVYEVSNYIENNKELFFLKEAVKIYPDYFKSLKEKRLPMTYSDEGMYISLAYFETLEKNGYGDIATLGILSGQYAKMAYYKKMIINDKKKGFNLDYPAYTEEQISHDISKAIFFANKTKELIRSVIDSGEIQTYTNYDLLKGVTEYASAMRYLNAIDADFQSTKSAQDIFSFATTFAYKKVPSLYLFTTLSNASTLLIVKDNNINQNLKNALYPLLSFDLKNVSPNSLISRVIQSRYEISSSRFADLGIYSKVNILLYAKKIPEFKKWLIINGWKEENFN